MTRSELRRRRHVAQGVRSLRSPARAADIIPEWRAAFARGRGTPPAEAAEARKRVESAAGAPGEGCGMHIEYV